MKDCTFVNYRNWVIINFFLNTGIRLSELTNIKIEDLNLSIQTIEIRYSKDRRERTLPLCKTMIKILDKYLDIRKGDEDDYLFPNVYNNKLTKSGLTHAGKDFNRNRNVKKQQYMDLDISLVEY